MNSAVQTIAGALSGWHGTFSPDNLVNYGKTIIVKPGAATDEGVKLSGAQIASLLSNHGFSVFPMGVEYAPSEAQAMMVFAGEDTDEDLDLLEAELDQVENVGADDEDAFGGKGKEERLKRRYLRVYGRFVKCKSLLASGKGYISPLKAAIWPFALFALLSKKDKKLSWRAKRCDRQQRRLVKIRDKMKRKGYDVSNLPDPRQIAQSLKTSQSSTSASQTSSYLPTPVYRQQSVTSQMTVQPMGYPQYRPGRRRRRSGRRQYQPVTAQGQRVRAQVDPAYFADQQALERQVTMSMPRYGSDAELAADLRAETDGYGFSGVEHDYFGVSGDVELVLSDDVGLGLDDDLGLDDFGDDDELGLDDFGDDDDDLGLDDFGGDDDELGLDDFGDDDDELGRDQNLMSKCESKPIDYNLGLDDELGLDDFGDDDELGLDDFGDDDELGRVGRKKKLTNRKSKRLNAVRAKLKKRLQSAEKAGKNKRVARFRKSIEYVDQILAKNSKNGGVDYSRIRPYRKHGKHGKYGKPAAIVIAIRKQGNPQHNPIQQYANAAGLQIRGNPKLIDVLAVDLYRSNQGYADAEAVNAVQANVAPNDWFGNASWPNGDAAPLPPPRRVGEEVWG